MAKRLASACAFLALFAAAPAQASPWAEVGDAQLRSDIEILAAAHVIDGITTHWPIPWQSIVDRLRDSDLLARQPAYVRAAADRLRWYARRQGAHDDVSISATVDATNDPNIVRGFDALGRETVEGQLSAEFIGSSTAVRLSLGGQVDHKDGHVEFVPDGSYIAQKIGGAMIYGGYLTHWWGPGWISALALSNNARPMPQIGIERADTDAFESPWLSWIGPWQFEFFAGLMDDRRLAVNTIFSGMRFTFNPLPGLEIGLARTDMVCGTGHPCVPLKYYFEFSNDPAHANHTNDEGDIDIKYSSILGGYPVQVYMQLMNEDSSPITHSVTSHLFGAAVWVPVGDRSNPVRLTAEYTDSVPTLDIFSFGNVAHGAAYNNSGYRDGMRYRAHTLGFSLDSDSTLLTLQGAWTDSRDWSYELTYHHAAVSNPNNMALPVPNIVTTAPVHINLAEARVKIPWRSLEIDLAARVQDDQPRPDHGFTGAAELALTYNFR